VARPRRQSEGPASKGSSDYTAASIQVLRTDRGAQAPGDDIGSTDQRGLHQLVWEVVDNSIDEAMANVATCIDVTIHDDGRVEVVDDGRGIPVGKYTSARMPSRSYTRCRTPAASSVGRAGLRWPARVGVSGQCTVGRDAREARTEALT
jgi:hypothetical protein